MSIAELDQETGVATCAPVNCNECPYRKAHISTTRRIGRLTLSYGVAMWDGQNLGFTMTELNVIERLVHVNGEWVSYRTIYDVMKGLPGFIAGEGKEGYRVNVRSCIKRMRKKFEAVDHNFNGIENLQCIGYRLIIN